MKRFFTRLLASALAVLIVTFAMDGVAKISTSRKISKLAGNYVTMEPLEADMVERMLTNFDFYPEEIALIDLESQTVPKCMEFRDNKSVVSYYDADAFRSDVERFFRQAFENLYANRDALSSLYNADFSAMTQAEFETYYATLYSKSTFDELVTFLAADAYNYNELTSSTGTFTIEDDKIVCKFINPFSTSVMGYDLSGNTLTLTYSDGAEVYTRIA